MFDIKNENELYLYDDIQTGYTATRLLDKLSGVEGALSLHINSFGGDVFEAIAVYNVLTKHEVNVYVDGLCASAASIIAMAGKNIYMPENAMMMIHNPIGNVYGTSEDMQDMAALLDKIRDNIAGIYAKRTGLSQDKIKDLMSQESWMNGKEAFALGFCTNVTGSIENKKSLTFEDGVKSERARLKALDDINASGREKIIARAKYETFEDVKDIALELLKAEAKQKDAEELSGIMPDVKDTKSENDMIVSNITSKIKEIRGV